MKILVLSFLTIFMAGAIYARTLDCKGEKLSYSFYTPDGGAPTVPSEQLKVDGQILISKGRDITSPFAYASFELEGEATIVKKEIVNDFETVNFDQAAQVVGPSARLHPPLLFFKGIVHCISQTYIGRQPIP